MEKIISRQDVKTVLNQYIEGTISLKDLQNWELKMSHEDFVPEDHEEDDSIINEIMHKIDMSDIDGLSINLAKEILGLLESKSSTKELIDKLYSYGRRDFMRKICNKHDIAGVYLDEEVNFDEYDSEIDAILEIFHKKLSFEEFDKKVYEIFIRFFDRSIVGDKREFIPFSKEVYNFLKNNS